MTEREKDNTLFNGDGIKMWRNDMIRNRSDGTVNDAVEEWQWFLESRSIFISLLLSAKQVKQGFTAYQRQGNSIQKHIGKKMENTK